jgi:hypothetical protein
MESSAKFRGSQHVSLPADAELFPIVQGTHFLYLILGLYAASPSRVPSNKAIVSLLGSRYNIHISCKTLERRVRFPFNFKARGLENDKRTGELDATSHYDSLAGEQFVNELAEKELRVRVCVESVGCDSLF